MFFCMHGYQIKGIKLHAYNNYAMDKRKTLGFIISNSHFTLTNSTTVTRSVIFTNYILKLGDLYNS